MGRDYIQSPPNTFPVYVFPEILQRIIHELRDSNGFPIDYTAASMMAAFTLDTILLYRALSTFRLHVLFQSRILQGMQVSLVVKDAYALTAFTYPPRLIALSRPYI